MGEEYYAHTRDDLPEQNWQSLETHLKNVGKIAANFASSFDAYEWGMQVGLLHDLGKYNDEFQQRLHGKNIRVDHSTPGAKYAEENIKIPPGAGRIIAYCVAGHHAGIPDGKSGDDDSCLFKRLERCENDFASFANASAELPVPAFLRKTGDKSSLNNFGFSAAFFIRMLYSALVDADFLDTESFIDSARGWKRRRYHSLIALKPKLDAFLHNLTKTAPDSKVNNLRLKILNECRSATSKKRGLFSLTVPTGGGKTLSSMAFALDHAIRHNLSRIIYVIPYTSIIEQTASIFKNIFGKDAVLEHHSNIIIEKDTDDDEAEENRRLAAENWDAPIIVTTNVQFFESFFANRSSRTRKLHNVAKSVVILDEAQMLPVPLLRPTIEVIRELAENYFTTIVLCTATQPALTVRQEFKGGLSHVREMMSDPHYLEDEFKRVHAIHIGTQSDNRIIEQLNKEEKVLCIVNTKKHARLLFNGLEPDKGNYQLSAAMCPQHRRQVLTEIRQRLKDGLTCRVVSTQLVEAGVDLDFPVVFRAMAGLDSIVQAAGRCNREGKIKEGGRLFVFESEDNKPPGHLKQNADITQLVLHEKKDKILATKIVEEYFKELYWLKDASGKLDAKNILEKFQAGVLHADFPFKTVAQEYRIIADVQKTVIVPYNKEARSLCDKLKKAVLLGWSTGGILRKLQPYTVQLYPKQMDTLIAAGFVEICDEQYHLLTTLGRKEAYSEDFGLYSEMKDYFEAENLMI